MWGLSWKLWTGPGRLAQRNGLSWRRSGACALPSTLHSTLGTCDLGGAEVQEREVEAKAGPGRRERGCLGLVVRVSETGPVWRTMFLIRGTARRPQQQIARDNCRGLSGLRSRR